MVLKLLDIAWDQWDHRISIATALQDSADAQRISAEVEEELHRGPQFLKGPDLRQFDFPEQIRALSTTLKCAWLSSVRTARKRQNAARSRALRSFSRERNLLARFLGRAHMTSLPAIEVRQCTHISRRVPQSYDRERATMKQFLAKRVPPAL